MKHIVCSIILGAFSLFSGYSAAHASNDGDTIRFPSLRYHAKPHAYRQGDSLSLRFSGEVVGQMRGVFSLHIIPLYISGNDTIRYPEISYFTPSGVKFNKRREALSYNKNSGTVCILQRGSRGDTDYQESKLVPSSMKGDFRLLQVLKDCCDSYLLVSDTVYTAKPRVRRHAADAAKVPLSDANVTFIRPEAEAVKERMATAVIRITYPVDQWIIYPDFGNNRAELQKVEQLLSPIVAAPEIYHISSSSITGYASPEDTYQHNIMLSENRAEEMRKHLQARYGSLLGKLTIKGKGEDWDGLRETVENSDMEAKEEVLHIIKTYGIFNGREKMLMNLRGGDPYRFMLRNFFPPLRRMEMTITYRVRTFKADEAAKLINSRPQDLSLYEMYEAARMENDNWKIIKQHNEYGRTYDIAARYFPDNDIANINASSAALVRGDLKQARVYLDKVKDNSTAYNNLGVCHWVCGEVEEAKTYFEKAKETDPDRATYNLKQLRKWEEEFQGGNDEE